jgi:type I restriction enzyme S subunit
VAPYLTVANVTRGALRLDEVKEIGMLDGDGDRYRLCKGDILFIEGSGNPALLGSAAVWNDELPFALHQNHLIRARLDQSFVLSEWVMHYVNSEFGRVQLLGKDKTSSGLHNINSRVIGMIKVPIPSMTEQRSIVDVLLACDQRNHALEKEVGVLDELFHAMLEQLMTGQLAASLS